MMEAAYLLVARGGLTHRNLSTWSEDVAQRLASLELSDRSPPSVGRLIAITNEAALIEAHRGDYESAGNICGAQLRNLHRHPDARNIAIARHVVNPWLNLGRLASVSGRLRDACGIFARFRDPGAIVDLSGTTLNLGELNALFRAEKGYPDFCAHLYIGNSLRALVRSGAWPELRAFTASLPAAHTTMLPILDEARLLAAMHSGDFETALRIARSHREEPFIGTKLIFRMREAESLGRLGRTLPARTWAQLEAGLEQAEFANGVSTSSLALGLHGARIAVNMAETAPGRRIAVRCLGGARRIGDEIYTHAALRVLESCASDGDRKTYGEAADWIAAASEYQSICGAQRRDGARRPALADAALAALSFQ